MTGNHYKVQRTITTTLRITPVNRWSVELRRTMARLHFSITNREARNAQVLSTYMHKASREEGAAGGERDRERELAEWLSTRLTPGTVEASLHAPVPQVVS